ncbi:KpsF/GutQ family sugar-phosphate isomerase [Orbus mooreae]|uniref:KpsF/GutQ family sugar-phosphate isomerase n=1 Tax=Orbus mooreae TaxID=3074107 RepID=UPI00370DB171
MSVDIIEYAQSILKSEAQSIEKLIPRIDEQFINIIELILTIKGRVICTGMGKPGYIAHKLAATLMSTGTPSIYLHPAEAIHGDLGMVTPQDVVIAISNSGETAEILNILPVINKIGAPLIAICGNNQSTLAKQSKYYLDAAVDSESCPFNLAPTNSTTAQLALGDTLAITLMKMKGFTSQDFAFYHPGGNLGSVRLLTLNKLLEQTHRNPIITKERPLSEALFIMTDAGIGAISVVDDKQHLLGIITDGDIRRSLKCNVDFFSKTVNDVMTINPTAIHESQLVLSALNFMQNHQPSPITVLPVINHENVVTGMIHITDIFKLSR